MFFLAFKMISFKTKENFISQESQDSFIIVVISKICK